MFELIISYMDDSTLFLQSVECRNVRVLELVTTGEERSRVWLVPKRRYPALNRVSVRRKLKGEISKRRMTQNVVENCWKTAVRWLASGRNERESLPFYYVIILPSTTMGDEPVAWTLSNLREEGRYSRGLHSALLCYAYALDREPVCDVTMANKRIDFACFAWHVSRSFVPSISSDRGEINSGGETFELPDLSNRKGIFVVRALA